MKLALTLSLFIFSGISLSQDSDIRVLNKVVDPLGNEIITINGTIRGSVKKFIKPVGADDYQAVRMEDYRYIAETPDLLEEGKRIGNSYFHSTSESCVEVTSSEGHIEYFVGPSSSSDFSQYRQVSDSFKKVEGEFRTSIDKLSRLPENIKPLDIHKLANGEYIYFDRDVNHLSDSEGVRGFQGTPGNMRSIEVDRFIPRPPVRCPAPNIYHLSDGRKVVAGSLNNFISQSESEAQEEAPAPRTRGGGCGQRAGLGSSPIEFAEPGVDAKSLGITGLTSEPIDYPSPCSLSGLGVAINQLNGQSPRRLSIDSNRREYDIEPPSSSSGSETNDSRSDGSSSGR